MKKIAVVAANGRVAQKVVKEAQIRGFEVTGFAREDENKSGAAAYVKKDIMELTKADLTRILTEPKNAITKQFKASFEMDDLDLDFTSDALDEIAETAIKQKTGARGLRSIVEKLLMDLMYEAPSIKGKKKLTVTKSASYTPPKSTRRQPPSMR